MAEVGDTVVGVAKAGNGRIARTPNQVATSQATNHASEAAIVFIEFPTTKGHSKEKTMSDLSL